MPIGILTAIVGAAMGMTSFGVSMFPPLRRQIEYTMNNLGQNRLLEPAQLIDGVRRGTYTEDEFDSKMAAYGYPKHAREELLDVTRRLLDADDLLVLKWRGEIDDEEFLDRMGEIGFDEEDAREFEARSKFYPSPMDLVNWQAKEVFEPDAVKKYGLDDELDRVKREAFYKTGMTDEQIRNFWRAHWEHPGWRRAREMYRRTTTDRGLAGTTRAGDVMASLGTVDGEPYYRMMSDWDMYEWFRLVEIPPYWRPRYRETALRPYTRVDVRRMHDLGVLSREQVKRAYIDHGYSDEKAEHMTEFTVKYNRPRERDLTRTMIEDSYTQAEITRDEALTYLGDMGYDGAEAELILTLVDYEEAEDVLDDKIDTIKLQYRHGVISEQEAIDEFDKLDISGAYRDKLVAYVTREKEKVMKLPTKTDLAKWFQTQLIEAETYFDYMIRRGYSDKDTCRYLAFQLENVPEGDWKERQRQFFKDRCL